MEEKCANCGGNVPLTVTRCPTCSYDVGFPNVRFATRKTEADALEVRLKDAMRQAADRGSLSKLEEFGAATSSSKAVMNRHMATLQNWLRGSNPLFNNFYTEIEAGREVNEDTYNRQRAAAENTINPIFYRELNIAALTLNNIGMTYYGAYSVLLRDANIRHRATVFEENPFNFNQRHGVVSGTDAPPGYRAPWADRGKLAMAKLQPWIDSETTEAQFSALLMGQDGTDENCDFIEVHIYDPIHKAAIERVAGPRPTDDVEALFWDDIKRRLEALGAEAVDL